MYGFYSIFILFLSFFPLRFVTSDNVSFPAFQLLVNSRAPRSNCEPCRRSKRFDTFMPRFLYTVAAPPSLFLPDSCPATISAQYMYIHTYTTSSSSSSYPSFLIPHFCSYAFNIHNSSVVLLSYILLSLSLSMSLFSLFKYIILYICSLYIC